MRFRLPRKKIIKILKDNGVGRASLFGSFARGEETEESDLDILIEFAEKNKSLLDLAGLKIELEEQLGRHVDVVTFKSLHPLLRDQILSEQVKLI